MKTKPMLKMKFAPYQEQINAMTNHEHTLWARRGRPTTFPPWLEMRVAERRKTLSAERVRTANKERVQRINEGPKPTLSQFAMISLYLASVVARREQRKSRRANR